MWMTWSRRVPRRRRRTRRLEVIHIGIALRGEEEANPLNEAHERTFAIRRVSRDVDVDPLSSVTRTPILHLSCGIAIGWVRSPIDLVQNPDVDGRLVHLRQVRLLGVGVAPELFKPGGPTAQLVNDPRDAVRSAAVSVIALEMKTRC